jgi:hypothetical protein
VSPQCHLVALVLLSHWQCFFAAALDCLAGHLVAGPGFLSASAGCGRCCSFGHLANQATECRRAPLGRCSTAISFVSNYTEATPVFPVCSSFSFRSCTAADDALALGAYRPGTAEKAPGATAGRDPHTPVVCGRSPLSRSRGSWGDGLTRRRSGAHRDWQGRRLEGYKGVG